jgi:thiopurine S-methyltransferase
MEPSFWHSKWDAKQIGFHQHEVNPLLIKHWSSLNLSADCEVFVPLCGKTLDICYLAELGHKVLGCELSQAAVEQFFTENSLSYSVSPVALSKGDLNQFDAEQVTLYQGDIFALTADELPALNGFYDRAALIAWPESMRKVYVEQLALLLAPMSLGLLITLDYPQEALKGPPFAVSNDWVMANMSDYFDVELLSCEDALSDNPRFVNKEVPWLTESVYRLKRKS